MGVVYALGGAEQLLVPFVFVGTILLPFQGPSLPISDRGFVCTRRGWQLHGHQWRTPSLLRHAHPVLCQLASVMGFHFTTDDSMLHL